ncbi:MAG: formylglycine-generating enzyme family protein [Planctomycetota bacterium]|nr:formylglycine-generating enzyme family protein [Planctomycetota bacterium]
MSRTTIASILASLALLLGGLSLAAQAGAKPASASTRYAFLVGISYTNEESASSSGAVDMAAVRSALVARGYDLRHTELLADGAARTKRRVLLPTKDALEKALAELTRRPARRDSLLVAVRCRITKVDAAFFLVPADGDPKRRESLIPFALLRDAIASCRAKHKLLFLDLESLPAAASPEAQAAFRALAKPKGTNVVLSAPGSVRFFSGLADGILGDADPDGHGLLETELLAFVAEQARAAAKARDTKEGVAILGKPSRKWAVADGEVAAWANVSLHQRKAARAYGVPVAFHNIVGMRFVFVPAGRFKMGRDPTKEKPGWRSYEVTLTRPFYLQARETSTEQVRLWRPDHDGSSSDEDPAVRLSYDEVQQFLAWLRKKDEERDYRLPTHAQSEYACRAGTTKRFWQTDDARKLGAFANVTDRSWLAAERKRRIERIPRDRYFATTDGFAGVAPCGSLRPNPWGLHDTVGNVWEYVRGLCRPWSDGPKVDPEEPRSGTWKARVVRGGGYFDYPVLIGTWSSITRTGRGDRETGFRVAIILDRKPAAPDDE